MGRGAIPAALQKRNSTRVSRLAQKQHIELRSPQIGVSILGYTKSARRIGLKFEIEPTEVEGGTYNGVFMELTREGAVKHIARMERAVELFDRDQKQEDKADLDTRYK